MVKIDLITGFLGSGKTTFIREYAKYLLSRGEKICIIENDYGAVNIDMVMLQDLLDEGCNLEMIIGGDGKEAHQRRFRTKLISMGMSGYTRVLIEPSGIYDVDEFFDVLYDEPMDSWYEIGSVISLVDTETVSELGDFERYIFMSEIACAGKIILTKLSDDTDVESVKNSVNGIMSEFGGKTFDREKDFLTGPANSFSEKNFEDIMNCGYRHGSYVKQPLDDKRYTPLFYFDVEMPQDLLALKVKELFDTSDFGHVIRVKGFVKVEEDSQIELNATEKGINISPVKSSRNVLIIIGENLNKQLINEIFKNFCSVVSL